MPGLLIDLTLPLHRFRLQVQWDTRATFLGIFGPSGAGKTTILEAIAGLRRGVSGRIRLDDRLCFDSASGIDLPPEERDVGYVPQDGLLFPHRDVLGNILAGSRRAEGSVRRLKPERVIGVLELSGLERRSVTTLSGGERQRVALARALCSGPRLLLLDEPLAEVGPFQDDRGRVDARVQQAVQTPGAVPEQTGLRLDAPLRRRILPFLLRVREEFALPTILVSHDPTEIGILSDEILVLSEGRVRARGAPGQIFADPQVFAMVREEGYENALEGRVFGEHEGMIQVELSPGCRVNLRSEPLARGRRVFVGLRAEDLILSVDPPRGLSAQNILPGVVLEVTEPPVEQAGGYAVPVKVDLAGTGQSILASITPRSRRELGLRPGLPIHVIFKAQACRLLAAL